MKLYVHLELSEVLKIELDEIIKIKYHTSNINN
jgi:hypothetical protein